MSILILYTNFNPLKGWGRNFILISFMHFKRPVFFFLFTLFNIGLIISQEYTDSLKEVLLKADEKEKPGLYNAIAQSSWLSNPKMALSYADSALKKARFFKSKKQETFALYNIGVSYNYLGSPDKALQNFIESYKVARSENNFDFVANACNAIGIIQTNLGMTSEALKYLREALQYYLKKNDPDYLGKVYTSLANVFQQTRQLDSAFFYCRKSQKEYILSGNLRGIANSYETFALLFSDIKNQDSSLHYALNALKIEKQLGNWVNVAGNYLNIHKSFYETNQRQKALDALDSCAKYALLTRNLDILHSVYFDLGNYYYTGKEYKESAEAFRKAIDYKDSTMNEQINEQFAQLSAQHENDKKEHELNMIRKEKELDELKLKSSRFYLYLTLFGALSLLLLLAFIYNRYKDRKKSHETLQVQHKEIKQQKEEITDSINYARRIQQAILPPQRIIQKLFSSGFIFYQPKDIVSGDFYFLDEQNGHIIFAAVDCTGHGVPGAMVSVVGFNLIAQAVRERELSNPAEILNFLDKGVNDTLRQSENESGIKDGMDLALCSYHRESKTLKYSGAFNPLILIRKNIRVEMEGKNPSYRFTGDHIMEIKADKFPIGNNHDDITDSYTCHTLQLQSGDAVYVYSDGFADQFGGISGAGKKFLYKRLKELLLEVSVLSPAEQQQKLKEEFIRWKGNHEQVDDVLVMGLMIG